MQSRVQPTGRFSVPRNIVSLLLILKRLSITMLIYHLLGMVTHTFNPRTREAEAGESPRTLSLAYRVSLKTNSYTMRHYHKFHDSNKNQQPPQ